MLKIAFHANQLSSRGTEVALYDYALHNEAILNNRSVIIYPANSPESHTAAIDKFKNRFEVFSYQSRDDLDELLGHTGSQLMYAIKSGKRDGVVSLLVPTMVHAVFPTSPTQIHGASYAYISEWLSNHCSNGKIPAVSHIVSMPHSMENWRSRLGIPTDALVLGGYGGKSSFDVPCAIAAVRSLLQTHPDVYFLFMNFTPFVTHERAIFLPENTDLQDKSVFVNTCDAMLHARMQGESFGLACGEFSIKHKPVLTYLYSKHRHHIDMLGEVGLFYTDEESLIAHVNHLPMLLRSDIKWDRYSATCNAELVMQDFDRHLIAPALQNRNLSSPSISIDWRDALQYWRFKWEMRRNHR